MNINIGLIAACGYWGKKILTELAGLNNITICMCSTHSNFKCLQNTINEFFPVTMQPHLTLSQEDVITNKNIDAVFIASPSETHYMLARQAIENKKHVFVEKPTTLNSREMQELKEMAQKNGLILFTDHTYLHSQCIYYIKELLDQHYIGKALFFHSNRTQMGIYRDHNILWDLAPHDLSILYYLFPSILPLDYKIIVNNMFKANADPLRSIDTAFYNIIYENGFNAYCFSSICHPVWSRAIAIVGSSGMIAFENNNVVKTYKNNGINTNIPSKNSWKLDKTFTLEENPLKQSIVKFLDLVEKGDHPVPQHLEPDFSMKIIQTIENIELIIKKEHKKLKKILN